MDLTGWLLRRAVPRPFVVTALGGTRERIAVERELRTRAWRQARAPAEADVLVVCGPHDPELAEAVDRLWDQVPGPRALARVGTHTDAVRALDAARAELVDAESQRRDAAARVRPDATESESSSDADDDGEHAGHDMSGGHSEHDMHADHDMDDAHGEHAEHDMHAHHMHGGGVELPGGLPMADRGPDRDGLTLDRLHLSLGPALPDWPTGLHVSLTIQGDVVQSASVEVIGTVADGPRFWGEPVMAGEERSDHPRAATAAALDSLHRLLSVAGWPDAATTAGRLRDDLLDPGPSESWRRACTRWSRTVRRSRLLRRSTNGVGPITPAEPSEMSPEVPPELLGDATARWNRWLDAVDAVAAPPTGGPSSTAVDDGRVARARAAVDMLPSLLAGRELAAVRLIVASLDPDLEAAGARRAEAHDG